MIKARSEVRGQIPEGTRATFEQRSWQQEPFYFCNLTSNL